MSPGYNQRSYTRVEIDVRVTADPTPGETFEGTMVELSAGGMSIDDAVELEVGTDVVCTFYADPQKAVTLRGRISWAREGRLGVEFTGYDTVSYLHFKEFLLEHAHDPHGVENEFLMNLDSLPEAD